MTDATPGAGYAHIANRDWEDDTRVAGDEQDPNTCDDIPEQLVFGETGKRLNVNYYTNSSIYMLVTLTKRYVIGDDGRWKATFYTKYGQRS